MASRMGQVYPKIEPYDHGMLDVGDGHQVYWEVCGNPDGRSAVVLHGGPGSGCSPALRRGFDPAVYRIVLFDQRGCGRSTPHAADPATDLTTNTTTHLLADIERLRRHLGIERWLVFGGSWGTTLGLAYAERHPERVSALVLIAIVTTTRREVQWVTRDVGRIFPQQWERFRDGVPAAERDWCDWEDSHIAVRADHRPSPACDDPVFRMCFARLVTHYWRHAAFLEDGILLREADKLAGIPEVLIHGRLDVSSPLDIAWQLARAWPDSELVVVEQSGHPVRDPRMTEALLTATARFAP